MKNRNAKARCELGTFWLQSTTLPPVPRTATATSALIAMVRYAVLIGHCLARNSFSSLSLKGIGANWAVQSACEGNQCTYGGDTVRRLRYCVTVTDRIANCM
jgi:hypothetical protein